MKTYLVTPLEITCPTDTVAIDRAIRWLRVWAKTPNWTDRYVVAVTNRDGEETGEYEVVAPDRGQYPVSSFSVSTYPTEADAEAECTRLNAEIDGQLRGFILGAKIELPDEVYDINMSDVMVGRPYPQSRCCTVSIDYQHGELGPIEFDVNVCWSSPFVAEDTDVHPGEVVKQLRADFNEKLAKAVDSRRAELSEEDSE